MYEHTTERNGISRWKMATRGRFPASPESDCSGTEGRMVGIIHRAKICAAGLVPPGLCTGWISCAWHRAAGSKDRCWQQRGRTSPFLIILPGSWNKTGWWPGGRGWCWSPSKGICAIYPCSGWQFRPGVPSGVERVLPGSAPGVEGSISGPATGRYFTGRI